MMYYGIQVLLYLNVILTYSCHVNILINLDAVIYDLVVSSDGNKLRGESEKGLSVYK